MCALGGLSRTNKITAVCCALWVLCGVVQYVSSALCVSVLTSVESGEKGRPGAHRLSAQELQQDRLSFRLLVQA